MPKLISPAVKEQAKLALKNPVTWWKGADLPEETLRPWEGGIQFLAQFPRGPMNGFLSIRDRYYIGMGEGRIPPMWKSASDVINITLDALTDPPIGVHMDRKNYAARILRRIMRFDATFNPLLIIFLTFRLGMSPLQRVILWTVMGIIMDAVSTANQVSETKIWAGITPHTKQRATLQLSRQVGGTIGSFFSSLPAVFMGLRHVLGITDYQIMVVGALAIAPFAVFGRWMPSFAKQRVDFTKKIEGDEDKKRKLTFRESFAIVKHNRWFMMWMVVNLIRLLFPITDHMFLYRFLIPNFTMFGREMGGEILFTIKNLIFGAPAFFLVPFATKAVEMLGGPVNFIKLDVFIVMFGRITSFLIGYQSLPRLMWMWTMEMFSGIMGMWRSVPHTMISYEMFDYVEWKTGHRSEGITASVEGIINKLIRDNIGSIIGGAVTQWTGYQGWDIPVEGQPARFINTIWPLTHLGAFFGELVAFIAIMRFKYPRDPQDVERDLIEKRALVQAEQQAMEEAGLV